MAQTEYGDITRSGAAFVVAEALDYARPILVLQRFGMPKPMPKNKSEVIHFRRPIPFAPATTPLQEGVTPTPKQMQYDRVEATLAEYGDVVMHTNKVEELATEPTATQMLSDLAQLLGEQAAETTELLTWATLRAGTSVFYDLASNATRVQVATAITLDRQSAITRFLKQQRAKKFTSILEGSVKIGTKPIEASYIAVAHTDLEDDIRSMSGFVPVSEYGTMKPCCPEELGAVRDVRYVLSPLLEPFLGAGAAVGANTFLRTGGNADVYPVIYLAKEAYGIVPLMGKDAIVPKIIAADRTDKADPLGQRGYAGWRTWYVSLILNQLWMARLEVAVTAL